MESRLPEDDLNGATRPRIGITNSEKVRTFFFPSYSKSRLMSSSDLFLFFSCFRF